MTFFNPTQQLNLKAFVLALSQQSEPLPPSLQNQLKSIGLNLSNRVVELTTIAASLPNLDQSFRKAQNDIQTAETAQDAEPVTADEVAQHSDELMEQAVQIFTDPDPVRAAQDHFTVLQKKPSNVWQRFFHRK
jgi:hypothetical protein